MKPEFWCFFFVLYGKRYQVPSTDCARPDRGAGWARRWWSYAIHSTIHLLPMKIFFRTVDYIRLGREYHLRVIINHQ